MDTFLAAFGAVLLIATFFPYGLASPSTVPAFMWSTHQEEMKEAVNYQTLSVQDLAKSVLSEGGWSDLLCQKKMMLQQPVDLAVVFVGRELQSKDIPGRMHSDPSLVNLLKVSYTSSNFSMAFPYVSALEEKVTMESSLISGFMEACGHVLSASNVAFLESCSLEGGNFEKLADLSSVHDYLVSRVAKQPKGQADLVVVCTGGSHSPEEREDFHFESDLLSKLMSLLEQLGTKYSVLYVSDPPRLSQYSSFQKIQRFLEEGNLGNGSANSVFCDEVCQIKSSLLEGLLVGIVLLIILISGLCCMAGIDTPTRFEAPQDS